MESALAKLAAVTTVRVLEPGFGLEFLLVWSERSTNEKHPIQSAISATCPKLLLSTRSDCLRIISVWDCHARERRRERERAGRLIDGERMGEGGELLIDAS